MMSEKFDKNNNLTSLDQEALISNNYAANLDDDKEALYERPKKHKQIKFLFFLILVVFIFLLVSSRLRDNIYDPLAYNIPDEILEEINSEENHVKTIDELKESDTDQDGLNDYQEMYKYYTSIFLPDTDSDGFTDAEEINLGQDPLCPIGESCNLLRLITPNTKLADVIQDIALDSGLTVQDVAIDEFRKFLGDNGMPLEELATLSDEDLVSIFRIMEESQIFNEDESGVGATAEQIRGFLLTMPGVDTAEINAMTDEELIAISEDLLK